MKHTPAKRDRNKNRTRPACTFDTGSQTYGLERIGRSGFNEQGSHLPVIAVEKLPS